MCRTETGTLAPRGGGDWRQLAEQNTEPTPPVAGGNAGAAETDGCENQSLSVEQAKRILLCLRYGIGDVVMELPALDALRAAAPGAAITALGAEPAVDLLADDSRVDELVSVQQWGFSHWGDEGTAASRDQVRQWLSGKRFDLVLDASHAVIGVRDAIWNAGFSGFDTQRWMHNEGLARGLDGWAAIKYAVRLGWGLLVHGDAAPRLQLGSDDIRFAERLVRSNLPGDGPLFAVSAVASSPLKRWPVPRLARLVDQLAARFGGRFMVFCGPQGWTVEKLLQYRRNRAPLLVLGDLHLKRVAALLAHCHGYVGNDTGLMHMAAAMEVPVVAVFGPTSPAVYLPPGHSGLRTRHDCSYRKEHEFGPPGCLVHGICLHGERSCIDDIDVVSVMEAIGKQARIFRRAS